MPHFEHVYQTAGSDLAVVAINAGFNDSIQDVRDYQKKMGITMPVAIDDGQLAREFNIRVTPTHIVIGRDGHIRYIGHLADATLDQALIAARSGADSGTQQPQSKALEASLDPPIRVGDLLPYHQLKAVGGKTLSLRASGQQLTALVFLSPWCESYLATSRPEVSRNCQTVREQVETMAHDPGIRWIGIASGLWSNISDVRQYQRDSRLTIPIALDETGQMFRQFRVNAVPTIVVADARGYVIRRLDPEGSLSSTAVQSVFNELPAGRGRSALHP